MRPPHAQGHPTADDITAWARANMAEDKGPKRVQFDDARPKTGSGKVMRRLLHDQEAEE